MYRYKQIMTRVSLVTLMGLVFCSIGMETSFSQSATVNIVAEGNPGASITRIDVNPRATRVYFNFRNTGASDTGVTIYPAGSNKTFVIVSLDGKSRLLLREVAGVAVIPKVTRVATGREISFELTFEPLPIDMKRFHIIENVSDPSVNSLRFLNIDLAAKTTSGGNRNVEDGGVNLVPIPKPMATPLIKNSNEAFAMGASDDIGALHAFLAANVPPQGEFEKTAAYDDKVAPILKRTVHGNLRGDSAWTGFSRIGMFFHKITYNPDTEIMEFPLATSSYFTSVSSEGLVLIFLNHDVFFNKLPNWVSRNNGSLRVNVNNVDAPSLKANARVAYTFRPVKPFRGNYRSLSAALYGNLEQVRIFDAETGKVFYDSSANGGTAAKKKISFR